VENLGRASSPSSRDASAGSVSERSARRGEILPPSHQRRAPASSSWDVVALRVSPGGLVSAAVAEFLDRHCPGVPTRTSAAIGTVDWSAASDATARAEPSDALAAARRAERTNTPGFVPVAVVRNVHPGVACFCDAILHGEGRAARAAPLEDEDEDNFEASAEASGSGSGSGLGSGRRAVLAVSPAGAAAIDVASGAVAARLVASPRLPGARAIAATWVRREGSTGRAARWRVAAFDDAGNARALRVDATESKDSSKAEESSFGEDQEEEVATTRGSAFDLMVASVAFVGDDDAPGGALACVAPMSTSRASAAAPPVVVVAPADPDRRSRRRAREEGGETSFRAASGAASDDPEYGLFDALRAVASLERASDAPFPPLPRVVAAEDVDARTRGAADASGCSRIFALGTVFEEEEEDAFEEEDDTLEEEDANARDGGGSRRGIPAIPAAIPAAAPVPGGTTRASAPRAGSAPLARRSRRLALLSFDAASATAACVAAGDARSAARRGDLRRVDADAGLSLALDLDERTLAAVGWEESEPAFDRRGRNRFTGGRLGRRLVVAQATPRGVRAFACAFASLFPPPRDAAAFEASAEGSGRSGPLRAPLASVWTPPAGSEATHAAALGDARGAMVVATTATAEKTTLGASVKKPDASSRAGEEGRVAFAALRCGASGVTLECAWSAGTSPSTGIPKTSEGGGVSALALCALPRGAVPRGRDAIGVLTAFWGADGEVDLARLDLDASEETGAARGGSATGPNGSRGGGGGAGLLPWARVPLARCVAGDAAAGPRAFSFRAAAAAAPARAVAAAPNRSSREPRLDAYVGGADGTVTRLEATFETAAAAAAAAARGGGEGGGGGGGGARVARFVARETTRVGAGEARLVAFERDGARAPAFVLAHCDDGAALLRPPEDEGGLPLWGSGSGSSDSGSLDAAAAFDSDSGSRGAAGSLVAVPGLRARAASVWIGSDAGEAWFASVAAAGGGLSIAPIDPTLAFADHRDRAAAAREGASSAASSAALAAAAGGSDARLGVARGGGGGGGFEEDDGEGGGASRGGVLRVTARGGARGAFARELARVAFPPRAGLARVDAAVVDGFEHSNGSIEGARRNGSEAEEAEEATNRRGSFYPSVTSFAAAMRDDERADENASPAGGSRSRSRSRFRCRRDATLRTLAAVDVAAHVDAGDRAAVRCDVAAVFEAECGANEAGEVEVKLKLRAVAPV